MSRQSIREGLVVGFIAYAAVATFYAAFDLLAARGALYTVNLLGQVLFRGLRDAAVLQFPLALDLMGVFWYNAFHLVVSLAIGVVVTGLLFRAERHPGYAPLILAVIIGGFVVTVLGVGFFTVSIRALLPWWSIVVANVLATIAGAVYLVRRHPVRWFTFGGPRRAVT
jgi:hypothetical protein